jgi:lysine 6-dehydrogenase
VSAVAVVGAAGIIAPAIVATLAEQPGVERIVCLDVDADGARETAAAHGAGRASSAALDVRDTAAAAAALAGADVVVSSAAYRVNLAAMEAALAAGAHYVDLGGLYHVTRRQLELDERFRAAGLVAVLGMGSTPGKTNVMAARAVERLGGRVDRIVVAAAGRDPRPPAGPLVAPYALETILDELTMPTPVWRDGREELLAPLTAAGPVEFGDPVGRAETIYTIHSEVATFPASFGARDVAFQLSLNPAFLDRVRFLAELGLAGREPVAADGVSVAPRALLLALVRRLPKASPSRETVGVHRVEAEGERGRAAVEAVTRAVDRLPFGGGLISTGAPPAIVAAMIARGELAGRTGVLPAELAVPFAPLFAALEDYGVEAREELDVR